MRAVTPKEWAEVAEAALADWRLMWISRFVPALEELRVMQNYGSVKQFRTIGTSLAIRGLELLGGQNCGRRWSPGCSRC